MKKITPVIVALLLAIAAWNALDASDMQVNWNGEEMGGPLGALVGLLCASGGVLAGLLVLAVVAVVVAFLMAGVGLLMVGGLALLALLLALLLAPFLLPLLIPLAILAFIATRGRRRRA